MMLELGLIAGMVAPAGAKSDVLDVLPVNILTCDPKTLLVNYVNRGSIATLNGLSHLLPPGVSGGTIIGKNIDVLYKGLLQRRDMGTGGWDLPYRETIRLGSEFIDFHADFIQSGSKVKKIVLVWNVCTEQVLDVLPVNVLTCDPATLIIDYANKASVSTLNKLSHLLPQGVTGDNIVGKNIDIFHKKPAYQRGIVSDDKNLPHKAIIRLGPELLELHIDAVRVRGEVKKLVLNWSVCTERERLRVMVDNMPINVMMCDPQSFEINYMNRTSLNTLKTIEHLLPVKAEQVKGTSVDRFHRDPAHQRRILSDPRNLPYRSKISLGSEMLDLNVAAITDSTGYYFGPMVSWSVITAQEKVAKSVMEISQGVSSMAQELEHTAQSLSSAAEESTSQTTSAAAAAEQATANVQTVAAAAEELSASIGEISSEVNKSNQVAKSAMSMAEQTNETVADLNEAAGQIGSVINIINDIAEKTNLLALNATIEAARAGEASVRRSSFPRAG